MGYVFGDCTLDPQRYELRRAGQFVKLRLKVFHVLAYLLAHRDRVVSKEELCEHLWPQQFISDATLDSCIAEARQAVGDSGRSQRLIQTIRGYGYRFVADLAVAPPDAATDNVLPVPSTRRVPTIPAGESDCRVHLTPDDSPGSPAVTTVFQPSPSLPLAALAGEHKVATVLVCTLVPAAPQTSRRAAEAWHQVCQAFMACVQAEVARYDGMLHSILEDSVLVLFGAPVAQEDHAQRAVLAALGLQQRWQDASVEPGQPLQETGVVHMGLHTGALVIGSRSDAVPLTYTPIGDTIRLATHLAQQAAPGTIVASAATAPLVHGMVDLEPGRRVARTDLGPPSLAYRVRGQRPPQGFHLPSGTRPRSPLVGRTLELATLEALLRQVEDGQGQVVSLVGEPGMGKTRLVHEFYQHLAPGRVLGLLGQCVAYGQATPYLPLCAILRQACGLAEHESAATITARLYQQLQTLGLDPTEALPYLLHLLDVPDGVTPLAGLSPQGIRRRTFALLHELFLTHSERQPLLVVIENVHWLDPTSQEYLAELAGRLLGMSVLLLVTFRPGYRVAWMEKSYATQMTLARLEPPESRQVVQAVLQVAAYPEPLLQEMVSKAAGNPLFLEELAWAVQEQGGLPVAVPAMVQTVLAARIDRLPALAKCLLQTAAVIGTEVPLALLQAITEYPEDILEQSLRHLQATEFLYEARPHPTRLAVFKHVLTQEAAYQSLLQSTRQQLHHRIADVLAGHFPALREAQPERLAYHYTEAGRQQQAVPYWQRAGQRALERSAHAEAVVHLSRGLESLQALPETPERRQHELDIQTTLGPALMAIKGWGAPEVEAVYNRARVLCQQVGETPQLFLVLWGLWRVYSERAEHRTARELGEQLLGLAQRLHDQTLLLQAHHALWPTLLYLGELHPARLHAAQGIRLYNRQQHHTHAFIYGGHDPGVCGQQVTALDVWFLGYPDQARQHIAVALCLAQEVAHPMSLAQALYWAAWLHQLRREAPATQERAAALQALSTTQEFALTLARGTVLHGWALAIQGQADRGIAQIQHGLAAHQATGARAMRSYFLALLAEVYGHAGHAIAGLQVLTEALAVVQQHAEHFYAAEIYRLHGELLQQTESGAQHADTVERYFQQALAIAHGQQARSLELRAALSLSRLWQQQGKQREAYTLLAPIYGWFTEGFETADLQEARGLLAALS